MGEKRKHCGQKDSLIYYREVQSHHESELETFAPEKQPDSSQNSLQKEATDSLAIDIFSSSD